MLQLFRANSPYVVIILFSITLLLKLQALAHAIVPVPGATQYVFSLVVDGLKWLFGNSATAFTLLAAILTFLQGLYLRNICVRRRLFVLHSYLPALAYIICASLHPSLGYFSAPLLGNWLVLGGIDTVLGFTRRSDQSGSIFNAGLVFAGLALLYFSAIGYAIFLFLSLAFLRSFKTGEWIIALLGYITPFYFAVCLLYLNGSLKVIREWPVFGISLTYASLRGLYPAGLIVGVAVLVISGGYALFTKWKRLPVTIRQAWSMLTAAFVIAILIAMASPGSAVGTWAGVMPVLSLFAVSPVMAEKPGRFATFTFYFLIMRWYIFCQFALRSIIIKEKMKFGIIVFPGLKLRPRHGACPTRRPGPGSDYALAQRPRPERL